MLCLRYGAYKYPCLCCVCLRYGAYKYPCLCCVCLRYGAYKYPCLCCVCDILHIKGAFCLLHYIQKLCIFHLWYKQLGMCFYGIIHVPPKQTQQKTTPMCSLWYIHVKALVCVFYMWCSAYDILLVDLFDNSHVYYCFIDNHTNI